MFVFFVVLSQCLGVSVVGYFAILRKTSHLRDYIAARLKRYEPFRDIYAEQCISRLRKLEEEIQ